MISSAGQGTRRWWALGALAASLLVVGLDLTVLNVALPTLATDLHASTGQLQWFADSYNLALAATLLPAGLLGDRYGRKRLLLAALVVFLGASVACAYAPSAGALIAARAVLGLGAAFLTPLSLAVLQVLFTPAERPRAIAIWVTATALGVPLGPVVGGWLLDNYWWGSVFLISVPLIVVALVAVTVLIPESRSAARPVIDPLGVLTSCLGLLGLTNGVIRAGEHGWGEPAALAWLLAGVVLLAGFLLRQRRPDRALIDLSLFRSPSFAVGTVLATLVQFGLTGLLFTMPQYFQAVGGADALGTGLRLLPLIGGLVVGTRIGGRLAPRLGAKLLVAAGLAVLTAALVTGAATGTGSGYGYAATWMSLVGVGLGLALPIALNAALSALTPDRSGVGSALSQAMRQLGGVIGVAILGTVLNAAYRGHLDPGSLPAAAADTVRRSAPGGVEVARQLGSAPLLAEVRAAFVHGMDAMLLACAGLTGVGIVLALLFLPARAVEATEITTAGVVGPDGGEDAESPDELAPSRP